MAIVFNQIHIYMYTYIFIFLAMLQQQKMWRAILLHYSQSNFTSNPNKYAPINSNTELHIAYPEKKTQAQ